MSDPRYNDPRFDPPPRPDLPPPQRMSELEESNAMWGWVAGGVVLALLLVFIFARGPSSTDTASRTTAPVTTGSAPSQPVPPATAQVPRPAPSTTGSGGNAQ